MERIARYRIAGELGRGAMGVVYRAMDPAINRTVAIKTIRLHELSDPDERASLRERLFREAQAAGSLSHPGIVTVYDVGQEDELAYIAMECVEGPTLDRLLASDPPDKKLVLQILSQTAAALDYAHKRGIVHRDIKPANIIVHERTTAKITDFGVAKIQSHQMTHAGSFMGTPNYMSPEQVQGQSIDGRADQYSLGVIAYELLTGERPFRAESIPALGYKIVNEQPSPPQRLNPTLGWPVETVLSRALAKEPQHRYPSCSDFVFALENACRSSKDWIPMRPGAVENMATVIGPAVAAEAAGSAETFHEGKLPVVEEHRGPPANVPKPLRVARAIAVVVLVAGLVSAALLGAYRYFSEDATPAQTAQVVDETERPARKPPPTAAVPDALPADTRTPAPEPAPAKPAANPDVVDTTGNALDPPQPPKPAIRGQTETRFVTYPPGAQIAIDGRGDLGCTAPCSMTLSPGRHTLAATFAGHRRALRIFELPQDSELFLRLDKTTGSLMVRSEPRGASIAIDGQPRPEKTPAMLTLATGQHKVEVSKDGQSETHDVEIKDTIITNLSVQLAP